MLLRFDLDNKPEEINKYLYLIGAEVLLEVPLVYWLTFPR
jgi:hypothetical protein